MSKSRLEKFLYALYSLDSSDLPTPLSRIEELYKCWVTGAEVSTFKPLSRVEKYLMAILGVYDADSLPNPLSRVEVLLYKLATGDDNLDDVKSFLSEHEELLAEIIRNGGAGGNIDIEYVLYTLSTESNTLYNTAEKPVKSAILKGNTLVNVSKSAVGNNGVIGSYWSIGTSDFLKPNTKYFCWVKNLSNDTYVYYFNDVAFNQSFEFSIGYNQTITRIMTTKEKPATIWLSSSSTNTSTTPQQLQIMLIEYQDGMENWDIPYFEGMQSVKMPVLTTTGKNLFDKNNYTEVGGSNFYSNTIGEVKVSTGTGDANHKWMVLKLPIGETYSVELDKRNTNPMSWTNLVVESDANTILKGATYRTLVYEIHDATKVSRHTFTTTKPYVFIHVGYDSKYRQNKQELLDSIMLNVGSSVAIYEPYKSNILTVNEEVELRGIGDIKDELNLLTGELTQRIGEFVLDGSQTYVIPTGEEFDTIQRFRTTIPNIKSLNVICDKLPTKTTSLSDDERLFVASTGENGAIFFNLLKTKATNIDELKTYLSQNPITIQYRLLNESVKTVDLSVVNQDGNNTKLSTFNDITHVTLSSEGLIPEAELEVATKNEEVLNTMSLEMDDISTTQTTLEETTHIQSENVDATMLATTEIYEQLL